MKVPDIILDWIRVLATLWTLASAPSHISGGWVSESVSRSPSVDFSEALLDISLGIRRNTLFTKVVFVLNNSVWIQVLKREDVLIFWG